MGLIWAVIGLPLLGFLVLCLLGTRIEKSAGRKALGFIGVAPIAAAFAAAAMVTLNFASTKTPSVVTAFPWIDILGLKIPFELVVDPLSLTMSLIVTGIGALIFLYSTGYMAEDRDYSRFFSYLNLFAASMLILVLGNNLPLLFIGWEGVGLCSYLLIGFWYQDLPNAKAANKAFIVNRIGDWGLMLGLFLIVVVLAGAAKSPADGRLLSYDAMLPALADALADKPALATAIALLLFVGACGKSAQFPLYVWLPDAMAGPTPVSALIHAATMVTSGVVLLNRMNVVFALSPTASAVVSAIGAFTALFAALVALAQTDIKKVLAYSTVSQLGFMFIGCGAGAYWTGMFHVTTHAFFKALLFLGAGAVIHAMAHDQDLRNYGGLRKYLPITFLTMVIGTAAIAGVPFLSGFFSKEAILGAALSTTHPAANLGKFAGYTGLFVAALTAFYMTRMTALTFFGAERWREIPADEHHGANEDDHHEHHGLTASHQPHEVPPSMWIPLAVLAVFSVGAGFFGSQFEKWLYPNGVAGLGEISIHPEGIPLMGLSIGAAALGIVAGLAVYLRGLPKQEGFDTRAWSGFRRSAIRQFGYDDAVTTAGVDGGGDFATVLAATDRSVVDGAVNGVGGLAGAISQTLKTAQTGLVRSYALLMLLGGVLLIGYFTLIASAATTGVR